MTLDAQSFGCYYVINTFSCIQRFLDVAVRPSVPDETLQSYTYSGQSPSQGCGRSSEKGLDTGFRHDIGVGLPVHDDRISRQRRGSGTRRVGTFLWGSGDPGRVSPSHPDRRYRETEFLLILVASRTITGKTCLLNKHPELRLGYETGKRVLILKVSDRFLRISGDDPWQGMFSPKRVQVNLTTRRGPWTRPERTPGLGRDRRM